MQMNGKPQDPAQIASVALKSFARIAASWGLSDKEAAGLADMSESKWARAKTRDFADELTQDQLLRLSAVVGIYEALDIIFPSRSREAGSRGRMQVPCLVGAVRSRQLSRVACRRSSRSGPISMGCWKAREHVRSLTILGHRHGLDPILP